MSAGRKSGSGLTNPMGEKVGEVWVVCNWRAWPALIDEDSDDCGAPLACRGLL